MSAVEFVPKQAETEKITAHVIWMTTGLSLRRRLVAMTSATSPSLEDIILGVIPGMPRGKSWSTTPCSRTRTGRSSCRPGSTRRRASSTPSSSSSRAPCRTRTSTARDTGPPWGSTRRPASRSRRTNGSTAWRRRRPWSRLGTCATYGGIPAMKNNPTGAMGLADYLGWGFRSKAGLPIVNVPGCPAQPDNTTETLLYLVLHLGGLAPAPGSTRRSGRSGCSTARCARGATAAASPRRACSPPSTATTPLPRQARLQGAGRQVQRPHPRLAERLRRLPERRRHLHGVHDAGLPRQVHAVHGGGQLGQGRLEHGAAHDRADDPVLPPSQHQAEVRQEPDGGAAGAG